MWRVSGPAGFGTRLLRGPWWRLASLGLGQKVSRREPCFGYCLAWEGSRGVSVCVCVCGCVCVAREGSRGVSVCVCFPSALEVGFLTPVGFQNSVYRVESVRLI